MARNNLVTLTGNLCDEPEINQVPGKTPYVEIRIATTDSYQDEQGKWVEQETVFHKIRFFGIMARAHARYYSTGQRVTIKGTLRYFKVASLDGKGYNIATLIGKMIEPAPLPAKKLTEPQVTATDTDAADNQPSLN